MVRGPFALALMALAACNGDFEGRVCDDCPADAAAGSPDAAAPPDAGTPDAADPCAAITCDQPPPDECNDSTLTDYSDTGTCRVSDGEPQCEYEASEIDCSDSDQECRGGACADPCEPNPCNQPPAARCTGHNLHSFASPGTCTSPAGVVACEYAETVTNCSAQGKVCNQTAGACVDP